MAEEERPAGLEKHEYPFIACLGSALIRLKEGSYLRLCFDGWALPFPRTGCAPRAGMSLVRLGQDVNFNAAGNVTLLPQG